MKRLSSDKSELTLAKLLIIIVVLGTIAAIVIPMIGDVFSKKGGGGMVDKKTRFVHATEIYDITATDPLV
ncbi:hypothetical protein [Bacillus songklensis]|uniref:hypothetical protein n=1 Tax=Bacillus songklensis TaxID=1069116 RepID=UPI00366E0E97